MRPEVSPFSRPLSSLSSDVPDRFALHFLENSVRCSPKVQDMRGAVEEAKALVEGKARKVSLAQDSNVAATR
jgi:hypothetical protein